MLRSDRFLIAILGGLFVIVALAIGLTIVRLGVTDYVDDSSPAGVVHNYVLALQQVDLERAYAYLADQKHKPTIDAFRRTHQIPGIDASSVSVRIGDTSTQGNNATVHLSVVAAGRGPILISTLYERPDRALLVRQGQAWRLTQMPYEFWSFDWYQDVRSPVIEPPPLPLEGSD